MRSRRPSGLSPPSTPGMSSPATSEGGEYATLLPGYVSRPGPSPIKKAAKETAASPVLGPGGFIYPGLFPAKAVVGNAEGAEQGPKEVCSSAVSSAEDLIWMELAEEARHAAATPPPEIAAAAEGEEGARHAEQGQQQEGGKPQQRRPRQARPRKGKRAAPEEPDEAAPEASKRARPLEGVAADEADRLLNPTTKFTAGVRCLTPTATFIQTCQQGLTDLLAYALFLGVLSICSIMQEAAVVAELPLPPDLDRLHALFLALNGVHSFLLSQHIQVCSDFCFLVLYSQCLTFQGRPGSVTIASQTLARAVAVPRDVPS